MRAVRLLCLVAQLGAACASRSRPTGAPAATASPATAAAPRFSAQGELLPPADYRQWVFLSSGFKMAYGPAARVMAEANVAAMDNVFVQRADHDAFVQTGVWPEGTLFVLEVRTGEGTGSIVSGGHFQTDLAAVEAEVKDSRRFPDGGWGFFAFPTDAAGPTGPAALLPRTEACYTCHARNAAVENTFTQFYPTLFSVARAKGTVRPDFEGMPATTADLITAIAAGGWPAGQKLLAEAAVRWPDANVLRESALNRAGYQLLAGHPAEAIALFEHVTASFPTSANAWDSLSEAYEGAGRSADALRAVDRGLQVVATDPAASPERRQLLDKSLRDRKARLAGS